jgi:hypothetical protein
MASEQEFQLMKRRVEELEMFVKYIFYGDRFKFLKPVNFDTLKFGDTELVDSGGLQVGTSTTQLVGFLGATPIAQQTTSSQSPATFSAGTSGIVDDSATWGGYTVGDLVAILQAYGFLA